MKKIAFTLTALLLAFSLTGCFGIGKDTSLPTLSFNSLFSKLLPAETEPEEVVTEVETTQPPTETQPITQATEAEETTQPPTETELETQPVTTERAYQEITISESVQYRANIFLSNFSELHFNEIGSWDNAMQKYTYLPSSFVTEDADPVDMLEFCWLNIKANSYSQVETLSYDSCSYYGIHIDSINYTCERFFDTTLSPSQIPGSPINEYGYYDLLWIGDYICKPAADGASYTNMTVANKIYDMHNGLYLVDFTIYSVNDLGSDGSVASIGGVISDKSVYYFTSADATTCSFLSYHLNGTAVVRPYVTPNGTDSYQLVSYDLFP